MEILLIGAGAALGAPSRYALDRAIQLRHTAWTPWGTLTVNLLGSLIMGSLLGLVSAGTSTGVVLFLGTGFCGAFTTYSSFGFETVRLLEERATWSALGNVAITLLGGLGAAMVGYAVAAAL